MAIASRCVVVKRGARKPWLVELRSRIEVGSGVGVPIPTLLWAIARQLKNKIITRGHNLFIRLYLSPIYA